MEDKHADWWGIWQGDDVDGGFVRDGDGRFYFYPGESIAEAQALMWMRASPADCRARRFGEFVEVERQRLADLRAGVPGTRLAPGERIN